VKATWPLPASLQTSNKKDDILGMMMNQFSFVSNSATTGHKLQGKTVASILVYEWTYKFVNWAYVVLSRVKTVTGLFLRPGKGLDEDLSKHSVPEELIQMLNRFRECEPQCLTFEECEQSIGDDHV
jgi:hypothetical protein